MVERREYAGSNWKDHQSGFQSALTKSRRSRSRLKSDAIFQPFPKHWWSNTSAFFGPACQSSMTMILPAVGNPRLFRATRLARSHAFASLMLTGRKDHLSRISSTKSSESASVVHQSAVHGDWDKSRETINHAVATARGDTCGL